MFIKTKNGIYEPTKWQCDFSGVMILVKANNKFGNDKIFTNDIIAKAETIEELVDIYVVKVPKDGYVIYEKIWYDRLLILLDMLMSIIQFMLVFGLMITL